MKSVLTRSYGHNILGEDFDMGRTWNYQFEPYLGKRILSKQNNLDVDVCSFDELRAIRT